MSLITRLLQFKIVVCSRSRSIIQLDTGFNIWYQWCLYFFFFGGAMVGDRPSGWGAGGGGARGWHRNDFFPITFIVHNQKSNGGGGEGMVWMEEPWSPQTTHPWLLHCLGCHLLHHCYILIYANHNLLLVYHWVHLAFQPSHLTGVCLLPQHGTNPTSIYKPNTNWTGEKSNATSHQIPPRYQIPPSHQIPTCLFLSHLTQMGFSRS